MIDFTKDYFQIVLSLIPLLQEFKNLNGIQRRHYQFDPVVSDAIYLVIKYGINGETGHLSVFKVANAIVDENFTVKEASCEGVG